MMTELINQGSMITQITGRPMKSNKLIDKFERTYKETDLFEKEAPTSLNQLNEEMGQTPGMANMMQKPQRPSVNTMQNQFPKI